jgi:uncharacterized integral membrane protein
MEKSMKKRTLIIWLIILGFIALIIFQNKAFFLESKTALSINIWVAKAYQTPELANAIIVLGFFVFGLVVAYLFGLSARFKAKRAIKKLRADEAAYLKELNGLKDEIKKLKSIDASLDGKADTGKLNMDTTAKIDAGGPADNTLKLDPTKEVSNPGEMKKK